MKLVLPLAVAAVLLLHQDFWLWKNGSLVFGFLPAGLAYHIAYTLLAAATMALLVRFAWPSQLEVSTDSGDDVETHAHGRA